MALTVDRIYAVPEAYGALAHLVGVTFFAFQIYGDFCGCPLVAIGLGRIMGLEFSINFKRPYFSKSFSEFWQRWHISLSSWLRDYLYIPLKAALIVDESGGKSEAVCQKVHQEFPSACNHSIKPSSTNRSKNASAPAY